jgi:hemolysin activation/secretion protein
VYVDHALVRGKSANLNALINWDQKDFHDKVYSSELLSAKTLQNTSLGFSGDIVHALKRPTQTQFSLLFSAGNVKTTGQDTPQSSSAAVAFGKANINLSHIKSIASGLDWQWSISGQTATTNLDVAEKMPVGGVTGVRAYPANEAYADVGFIISTELRKSFSSADSPLHQLQWIGFVDMGQAQLSKESTSTEANQIRRSGFGMGIQWVYDKTTQFKTLYAQKIASADEISTSAQGRIWVQGYRSF